MTTTEAFEALMPEPVGFRSRYRSEPEMIGHYPWTWAGAERRRRKYDRPECEYDDLYTAEQMREAMQAAARQEREDGKLLDALHRNSWDLVAFDIPTGSGDADVGWRVIGHYTSAPNHRTIGEVFKDDPRGAIAAAIRSEGGER